METTGTVPNLADKTMEMLEAELMLLETEQIKLVLHQLSLKINLLLDSINTQGSEFERINEKNLLNNDVASKSNQRADEDCQVEVEDESFVVVCLEEPVPSQGNTDGFLEKFDLNSRLEEDLNNKNQEPSPSESESDHESYQNEFNPPVSLLIQRKEGEHRYECSLCGKCYKSLGGARHHTQTAHKHFPEKDFSELILRCEEEGCNYTTDNKNLFRAHFSAHANNVPAICPICRKEYLGGPKALKEHMKIHDSKRNFKCDQCNKSFINQSRRNYHIKNVHSVPGYNCHLCSKLFRSKANFNRHLRTHTNEKPFNCPHCSFSSNNSGNLSTHVRKVHNDFNFTTGKREKMLKRDRIMKKIEDKGTGQSILNLLGGENTRIHSSSIPENVGENLLKVMKEKGEIDPSLSTSQASQKSKSKSNLKSSGRSSRSFLKTSRGNTSSSREKQTITVRNSDGVLVKAVVKVKSGSADGDQVLHVCFEK